MEGFLNSMTRPPNPVSLRPRERCFRKAKWDQGPGGSGESVVPIPSRLQRKNSADCGMGSGRMRASADPRTDGDLYQMAARSAILSNGLSLGTNTHALKASNQ